MWHIHLLELFYELFPYRLFLYLTLRRVLHQASASSTSMYILILTSNLLGTSTILNAFLISLNHSSTLSYPSLPPKFGGLVLMKALWYAAVGRLIASIHLWRWWRHRLCPLLHTFRSSRLRLLLLGYQGLNRY